ncbi:MAG: OmpA family protein [Treponema sp.]|jgi:outer membrane protein OmpA-like peptidoglycan-associated protein|nr:OmpA family protein [Treponema sp.]
MKTGFQFLKLSFLPAVLFLCLFPFKAGAEDFFYKHQKGDRYRIVSTVSEEVYIDDIFSHKAEILNRITGEVIDESGGKGKHKAVFQTSERAGTVPNRSYRSYQWAREYESEFERDRLGRITIDKKYFMPVVRDVPVFPGRDIKVGESWTYEGHEVHDFRDNFGIKEPYRIPFTAHYVYLGEREWKGKSYPAFSVNYRIQLQPKAVPGKIWPRRIQGESDQVVYWDSVQGQAVAYNEQFGYVFEFSNGRKIEYLGRAEAEVVESIRMDKEKIAGEIAEDIDRLGIPDVSVRVVDDGITISLDDIKFQADTAVMLPGEREKLDKIAEILQRYQERDILVGGHTALAGTAEGRKKLSTERAAIVADYLIARKARSPDRVVVRGYGSDKPVADNRTEEGKRKNRRVEITILEN